MEHPVSNDRTLKKKHSLTSICLETVRWSDQVGVELFDQICKRKHSLLFDSSCWLYCKCKHAAMPFVLEDLRILRVFKHTRDCHAVGQILCSASIVISTNGEGDALELHDHFKEILRQRAVCSLQEKCFLSLREEREILVPLRNCAKVPEPRTHKHIPSTSRRERR